MAGDDVGHDRQTEAGAAGVACACGVETHEAFEDDAAELCRDAPSGAEAFVEGQ